MNERGRATREHLLSVATRLFTEAGYDGTSVEAVLRASGVSRGALYHHFPGKDALFAAVLDAVQEHTDEQVASAARACTDPVEALRAGCLAWIRLAADPSVHRILLIDAPAVLGWQRWRELDERRTLGRIRRALRAAAEQGLLPAGHADLFAHAVLAGINEIAMVIVRAPEKSAAVRDAERVVDDFLTRLLRP